MYSVGIDASKGKSTVCIINQYGEVLLSPKDYKHNKEDLALLSKTIKCSLKSFGAKVVRFIILLVHDTHICCKDKNLFGKIILFDSQNCILS